jgi:Flp pilus assembly protein TadB
MPVTTWTWVIVFCALAVAALVAIAACAWPVWRAGMALVKQLGKASETFGEAMEPLSEALDKLGADQGSSPRR